MSINPEEDYVQLNFSIPPGGGGGGGEPDNSRVVVMDQRTPRNRLISRNLLLGLGLFVIIVFLVILTSLVLHWYLSVFLRYGEPILKYNHEKMTGLQPKVVKRVKELWETANSSIHDMEAREFLRNLSKTDRSTCYSALCVKTALNLLESMNWKYDPCSDFYMFSCGGFIVSNPPASSSSLTDHFAKINERVVQATQHIIDQVEPSDNSSTGVELARALYNECTDVDKLEEDGLEVIVNTLESHGGWPMMYGHIGNDSWKNKWSFNWLKTVALLQRLMIQTILSIEIKQDILKADINSLYVIDPSFFLSREFLIAPERNAKLLTAYKQFIIDTAVELLRWKHIQPDINRLDEAADQLILFEVSIAKLVSPESVGVNLTTFWGLISLQKETDRFYISPDAQIKLDWKEFLDMIFENSEVTISQNEVIHVHDLPYIEGLVKLVERTPTETVANYLMWRLMVQFTTGSTKALRKIHSKFYESLYGEQRQMNRNSTCAMMVVNKFAIAIGSEFIKDSFESSLKREVEVLAVDLKKRMEEFLGRQSFIQHLLQLHIRRKLASLRLCVGYPREFSNTSYVTEFYKDLNRTSFQNSTYIEKFMYIASWLFLKSLVVLRQPFDRRCWGGNYWREGGNFIGEAYAYYDTARKTINLPVGLLQSPFYYQRRQVPKYLNYGGIGTIIGHELTHSLNLEGLIRVKLVDEIEYLMECLISSYSQADIAELDGKSKVDGYRTRSENFADHIGLASAFWAYQQHIKSVTNTEDEEKSLPGLEFFSSSQMFFISFANMWCDSKSKESLYDEVESSTHTPSKYRVLGALKNSKDFSQVWSCSPGTKMNPIGKCNLF